MGTYPKNVEKTKTCLCEKFSPGGEFSETKVANVCGSNPGTPPKHLPLLQDKIVCGQMKLVKVEGTNRWTLVVPDDPFDDLFDDSLESDKVSGADLVAGLTLFTGIMVPVVLGLSKCRKLHALCMHTTRSESTPLWEVMRNGERIVVSHDHQITRYGYCPTCGRYVA